MPVCRLTKFEGKERVLSFASGGGLRTRWTDLMRCEWGFEVLEDRR